MVDAGVSKFQGQVTVYDAEHGPCYRCLYPEPPAGDGSCSVAGVLGVVPGILGLIQAGEAIKLLLNIGKPLVGRLLLFDSLEMKFKEVKLEKNPQCPVCGDNPVLKDLTTLAKYYGSATPVVQEKPKDESTDITPEELKAKLDRKEKFLLVDVRESHEYEICRIEGSVLLPLSKIGESYEELDGSKEIVVYCHHGNRSSQAMKFLKRQSLTRVKNLIGGIDAWSKKIDPSVPRY